MLLIFILTISCIPSKKQLGISIKAGNSFVIQPTNIVDNTIPDTTSVIENTVTGPSPFPGTPTTLDIITLGTIIAPTPVIPSPVNISDPVVPTPPVVIVPDIENVPTPPVVIVPDVENVPTPPVVIVPDVENVPIKKNKISITLLVGGSSPVCGSFRARGLTQFTIPFSYFFKSSLAYNTESSCYSAVLNHFNSLKPQHPVSPDSLVFENPHCLISFQETVSLENNYNLNANQYELPFVNKVQSIIRQKFINIGYHPDNIIINISGISSYEGSSGAGITFHNIDTPISQELFVNKSIYSNQEFKTHIIAYYDLNLFFSDWNHQMHGSVGPARCPQINTPQYTDQLNRFLSLSNTIKNLPNRSKLHFYFLTSDVFTENETTITTNFRPFAIKNHPTVNKHFEGCLDFGYSAPWVQTSSGTSTVCSSVNSQTYVGINAQNYLTCFKARMNLIIQSTNTPPGSFQATDSKGGIIPVFKYKYLIDTQFMPIVDSFGAPQCNLRPNFYCRSALDTLCTQVFNAPCDFNSDYFKLDPDPVTNAEIKARPFFSHKNHIPAGKMCNGFSGYLGEVCPDVMGHDYQLLMLDVSFKNISSKVPGPDPETL